jgi:hypothetical protein
MRKMHSKQFISLLMLFFTAVICYGQTEAEESNLKAAFIYNFTRFVEWEPSSVANDFIIGIVGASSVDEPLEEISKTRTVNTKKIIIKHFEKPEDIDKCNILFIPKGVKIPLQDFLTKIETKDVLLITEKQGYASKGSSINFVLIDNKLKFEANQKAITSAGLKVSAQLLKLAIIVN